MSDDDLNEVILTEVLKRRIERLRGALIGCIGAEADEVGDVAREALAVDTEENEREL